jgi:bifunctional non-homologous end joining protein LigD
LTERSSRSTRPAARRSTCCSTTEPGAGLQYYAFDALIYRGRSVLAIPLTERRKALAAALVDTGDPVRATVTLDAPVAYLEDGVTLYESAKASGLEGIVAKRLDSRYEPVAPATRG